MVTATGLLAGLFAAAFHWTVEVVSHHPAWISEISTRMALPGWFLAPVIAGVAVAVANWLVRRFAGGRSGSGVPAVIETLRGNEPPRWTTMLPAQFGAGVLGLGAGLVLGREGPTVHMGSSTGALVARCTGIDRHRRHTLILAGAAAGLAAALNAPLAGIIFIIEDMREEFDFTFHSVQAVILAVTVATIVSSGFFGQGPVLEIPGYSAPPLSSLWLCIVLGILVGVFAVGFNRALVWGLNCFRGLPQKRPWTWSLAMGATIGTMAWLMPETAGSGERILLMDVAQDHAMSALIALIVVRTALLVASYSTGVPGGLYAPLLAVGTLLGLAFGHATAAMSPVLAVDSSVLQPGVFAIASMGALFAASVRAPLTGIALVVEMTGNFDLLLAVILTALSATLVAEALGGRPLFDVLAQMTRSPENSREPPTWSR